MFDHLTITENWCGEGLPPIGERVGNNQLNSAGTYEPAIIVAHVPQGGELIAVFALEDKSDWSWSSFGRDDGNNQCFIPWGKANKKTA